MTAEVKDSIFDLVQTDPNAVFTGDLDVDDLLRRVEKEALAIGTDVGTDKSRKAIISMAARVTRVKTAIDGAGKDLTEDHRKAIDAVNKVRKTVRDRCDEIKVRVRKPVDRWEEQENARIESHRAVIAELNQASRIPHDATAGDIAATIKRLEVVDTSRASMQEYAEGATAAKNDALDVLRAAHERAVTAEQERAELERLRKESAEREAREATERAERDRQEREAEAARQREAAEAQRREENERIAREAAERAAAQAEQRAREEAEATARKAREQAEQREREHQAEIARLKREAEEKAAAEQRAKEEATAEERRRAADRAHRSKIVGEAAKSLASAAGIDPAIATAAVEAIASGAVTHLSLQF
ncbi:hypothetical protein L1787_05565 [Acuticoccus sp. M5D2P5]|uniref:hypothetical protein n=1 Tax=Acuticoccus kalidii TaxID=2910977 RepID=UPI001F3D5C9F|nr:hypothetical protein [Acuticoccus kalidii]MCF3932881.1 hypothetical protein [Acuticoccus kalidii]